MADAQRMRRERDEPARTSRQPRPGASGRGSRPVDGGAARAFEVIPSIDIRGGRCVRLYQGDYARETVYDADPVAVARRWAGLGAPRLHVVDLDAARTGEPVNAALVTAIARAVAVPVQAGGGIRDEATARRYLEAGVRRVVLGTAAVRDPALVERLAAADPEAVVVALDARDGVVRTDGWTVSGGVRAEELARWMMAAGVRRFLYTDIARDATLTEPNYEALGALVRATGAAVIASGGVARVAQLRRLAAAGAEGAIIGRALYTGDVDLTEALKLYLPVRPTGGAEDG
jgi:phosphoribosylformimino-5-aminoimidazole carboxamide ribotide isomerase